jgi:hypothetical protein
MKLIDIVNLKKREPVILIWNSFNQFDIKAEILDSFTTYQRGFF